MKTKFSELLKVRKQKLSEIERELADKQSQRTVLQEQVAQISGRIAAYTLPQSGSYTAMQVALGKKAYLFRDKEHKENMIKYFDQEIKNLNILYKEATIAYEKIKHLHEREVAEIVAEKLRQEAKEMDEIAGQLFYRHQTGR